MLAGWVTAAHLGSRSDSIETTGAIEGRRATSGSAVGVASAGLTQPQPETPSVRPASAHLVPRPETPPVQIAAASPLPQPETPPVQVTSFPPMQALDLPPAQVAAASPVPPEDTAPEHGGSVRAMPPAETPTVPVASAGSMPAAEKLPSLGALMRLASVSPTDPLPDNARPTARSDDTSNECLVAELCIDQYLWSLYQRAPKVDTVKMEERIKVTVERKGKLRTVFKTITKYVVQDFTWKDPVAAQHFGMSLQDYVIGGMDRRFKTKLYQALRAMDAAGLEPGITSAFRDDYRQALASGNKAQSDSSYHGGSRRGGYGRGMAVDLVSVKGETRIQRLESSDILWKWIDAHGKEFGIGRPYLDRDPPHIGPIDGKEYADKRGRAEARRAALENKQRAALAKNKRQPLAGRSDPGKTKRVGTDQGKTKRVGTDQGKTKRVGDDPGKAKRAKTAASKARNI